MRAWVLGVMAVAAPLVGCGAGRSAPGGGLEPPGEAVPVDPGRQCVYADEPGELPALGRVVPASARTRLALWGEGGEASDTLEVSIRYDLEGGLEWVRVMGSVPPDERPARRTALERLLRSAVPPVGREAWGVRLVVTGGGTPVRVLPAVVCEPQAVSRLATAPPVGTPTEVAAMRRARGRQAEVRVLLDDRGHVVDAEVVRTSGSRLVDAYALAAARNTSFRPGLHDGFPVTAVTTLRFRMDWR